MTFELDTTPLPQTIDESPLDRLREALEKVRSATDFQPTIGMCGENVSRLAQARLHRIEAIVRQAIALIPTIETWANALHDEREDENEAPTCEGCGDAKAEDCIPCFVTFRQDCIDAGVDADGTFMYCESCIEAAQGGIRAGAPDNKRAVVRLDWRFFEAGVLSRFYRVGCIDGKLVLQACDRTVINPPNQTIGYYEPNTDSIVDVRRWPFGLGGLDQLNRITGATFTYEAFENDC